eukprot:Amastigsp_a341307_16.p1 type:complete len:179 gc:universal Amastigsp_a341307_16:670-134(-)
MASPPGALWDEAIMSVAASQPLVSASPVTQLLHLQELYYRLEESCASRAREQDETIASLTVVNNAQRARIVELEAQVSALMDVLEHHLRAHSIDGDSVDESATARPSHSRDRSTSPGGQSQRSPRPLPQRPPHPPPTLARGRSTDALDRDQLNTSGIVCEVSDFDSALESEPAATPDA